MAKQYFLYAMLIVAFVFIVLVHGQDQSDFISIDCGALNSYKDEKTGINYTPDTNYTYSGVRKSISQKFKTKSLEKQYSNVRSFPHETRNCFSLRPSKGKGSSYLIRAGFMYGNYDSKDLVPEFDLYLGPNKWDTVRFDNVSSIKTLEIIHVLKSDNLYVCLINTGSGKPFISVLELRPVDSRSYVTQFGSLELFARFDFGSSSNQIIRYEDDVLDRKWSPFNLDSWKVLNTSTTIKENYYQLPPVVMTTAVTPNNENDSWEFSWSTDQEISGFKIYMHFAEVSKLQVNETRKFNIYLNNSFWFGPLVPSNITNTIRSGDESNGTKFQVLINKTEESTLPPIINAFEIYRLKYMLVPEAHQNDVIAINKIKSTYGRKENWQGDPCGPEAYKWVGVTCSKTEKDSPRIIALNLSSSELKGEIAPYISDLSMLQMLDLSNNSLIGLVPDFLSELPFLTILNLDRNNFSGTLPMGLYEKSENKLILLSMNENPNLCTKNPCEKKEDKKSKNNNNSKFVIPVVASIGAFLILLLATLTFLWGVKRRKQAAIETKVNVESNQQDEDLEPSNQQFTYSEVLRITNNFSKVIGKGGFGTVYHGNLNNREIAVKILSQSSAQGYKQFHAEAELLTRVYHGNLTTLVGYCVEGPIIGLIYEYMANGDLAGHLSDKCSYPLNWEERLKIALDAAQGLEYLHNGCKPPIIHRDVKTTNILLNEKLQAKLVDFGLSRAFPTEDDSHVFTTVVGTPGYLDPEYHLTNKLTEKSDVFSYGIVLLQIITGRPATEKNTGHIIEWVKMNLSDGDMIKKITDARLNQDYDKNSAWKALEVASACTSPTSTKRPNMTQVVMELKQCLAMEMARSNIYSDVIESSHDFIDSSFMAR